MTDLYVRRNKWDGEPDQTGPLDPASPSEILSAALNLEGVETVDWCGTHRVELKMTYVDGYDGLRECQDSPYFEGDCSIVPVAIIPLPPEADE